MFPDYLVHAERSLELHGPAVFSTLASRQHFHDWLRQKKSQDASPIAKMSVFSNRKHEFKLV